MKPAEAERRRQARAAALQMLYQCDVGRTSPADTVATYWLVHSADSETAPERSELAPARSELTPAQSELTPARSELNPEGSELNPEQREFANRLLLGTTGRLEEIDALVGSRAENWRVERMAVLDRAVLRLATYELLAEAATPAKVIINEALELTRIYSGEQAVGFVNGVLDGVRKELGRE